MPKMVLKQESRLNGVKTNIFNLGEVAKALRVPEDGISSYPNLTNSFDKVLVCWVGHKQGAKDHP